MATRISTAAMASLVASFMSALRSRPFPQEWEEVC
jgi:hypothetical protein